jgi:hypothetical protein
MIGLQVAPFSVSPTEQIAYFLGVARKPRLGDAAPPRDGPGGDAMGFVVGAAREVEIREARPYAAEAGSSRSPCVDRERRATRYAQRDGKTDDTVRSHLVVFAYEPAGVSVRPRDSSNGPMSGALP